MDSKQHWQRVYANKAPSDVSWYRAHLEQSLSFIRACRLAPDARIVDVGGGTSTLVDDLLELGYQNVAVIDLADAALAAARARLGTRAAAVDWIAGDVTAPVLPPRSVDFWHDRAVFHFLTRPEQRAAYVAQATASIKPGGHLLVATFGPDGPDRCSGLPVARYDAAGIHGVFADMFDRVGDAAELHQTPGGAGQSFVYCLCRRRG